MIDLKVSGMTCGGCVRAVEKAVARTDAKASVSVDLPTGVVRIESERPRADFASAIEAAGYDVEPA
ncbi:heavy-metal-associated domain-containing protein [Chthonobacter albigriseus]|uniref:heavy-metal-associated domain-containing protein n=1 Tax=Chthonobacter albigriseus TaxID=1683161 RepID=UPI0015EFC98F|nr:heavy-metal-associated domain-containing protein [Chthonobacter albigriseus]